GRVVHDGARGGEVHVGRPQERAGRGPRGRGGERVTHVLPLHQVEGPKVRDEPAPGTVAPVVGGRVDVESPVGPALHGGVGGDRGDHRVGRRRRREGRRGDRDDDDERR